MGFEIFILAAVLGLIFGSFISAVSYRIPRGISFKTGRSMCMKCEHSLKAVDLIPLFSWIIQKGKCRYCKADIPARYPLIEISTAAIFVFITSIIANPLQLLLLLLIAAFLIALTVVDLETGLLPSVIVYSLLPFAAIYRHLIINHIVFGIIGALVAVSGALLLNYAYKKLKKRDGIGMGDIRFCLILGMLLNLNQWVVFLLFAGGLGVLTGLYWKLTNKGRRFPFGPAIMVSLLICLLFEKEIQQFFAG